MKIAVILPSLARTAPIMVARDIVSQIYDKVELIDLYYFDDIVELGFKGAAHHISFDEQIDFNKYDIIHTHCYRPAKYVFMNRKNIHCRTITTIHSNMQKDIQFKYNYLISKLSSWIWYRYVGINDKIVVLSNSALNYYSRYFQSEKLVYIYNGKGIQEQEAVDGEDMELLSSIRKRGLKIIGSNAFISKVKGLNRIIEALPALDDYSFVVVGEGEEKEQLIKLAKKLKVYERCFFLGYRPNAVSYLPFYDVYAMPSISEGFGLALIEAVLMKRSCVCSDIPVLKEIFTDDEVTFFDLNRRHSLAAAIETAYKERVEKGGNAYKKASSQYSVEQMGEKYLKLYNGVLNLIC